MTREQWFQSVYARAGFELGIVTESMYSKWRQYSAYKANRVTLPHMEAIERVAEEERCSTVTVWNSVQFFLKSSG